MRVSQTRPVTLGSVCVFSGSSLGARPDYVDAATALGRSLAEAGTRIVYGGASVGLMGVMADAALAAGGEVIGVIPESLVAHEVAHAALTDLRTVGSMHERKQLMADLADAFIALPGGYGTLDESFESLTWTQLGLHAKPLGFLNVAGYFDALEAFLDHAEAEGFLRPQHRPLAMFDTDAASLLHRLEQFVPPTAEKWVER